MAVNLLVALLLISACRSSYQTPQETLVIGLESAPKTPLDPRQAMVDGYSSKIADLIFDSLFQVNEKMEVVPDLLASIESATPQLYRCRLKPGIQFHDGRPLTADDVKKTIESILDPATGSPHRETLRVIQEIRVKDEINFELVLSQPFAPLFDALRFGILPGGQETGIGSGPYQVEDYRPGESLTLIRNEHYRGPAPKMKRLQFRIVPDDNVRLLELISGRIDFVQNNLSPPLFDYLRRRPEFAVAVSDGINQSYLGMNLTIPPLNDPRVREAMARAPDIPYLIQYQLGGLAQPATGILAPLHWAYEGNVIQYPYSPETAKKLLDEAGWKDPDGEGPKTRFTLTYKTSTNRQRIAMARLIAGYFKKIGIEVRVLPYEWGTFFHDIRTGNFQLYSLTWVGITEPDIFHYAFHSSQMPPVGANRNRYHHPALDSLTEEARKTLDPQKRRELYSDVQKLLAQDLPMIPLWYEKNSAVFRKNVRGVQLRPDASFKIFTEIYKE